MSQTPSPPNISRMYFPLPQCTQALFDSFSVTTAALVGADRLKGSSQSTRVTEKFGCKLPSRGDGAETRQLGVSRGSAHQASRYHRLVSPHCRTLERHRATIRVESAQPSCQNFETRCPRYQPGSNPSYPLRERDANPCPPAGQLCDCYLAHHLGNEVFALGRSGEDNAVNLGSANSANPLTCLRYIRPLRQNLTVDEDGEISALEGFQGG